MEANTLVIEDERTCLVLKTNAFGPGDKITRLRLETKACSAKDGVRLMLKANMFGARDKLTRLAIETNAFGTGGERISQQTMYTFAGRTVYHYIM